MQKKQRKQLHISGINMMSECAVRFEWRYIKGVKIPPSTFLICGSGTDTAVGADLQNKIDTRELLPEDVVLDVAAQSVEERWIDAGEVTGDEGDEGKSQQMLRDETKDKAVRLTRKHHRDLAPTLQPAAVARQFSINMDHFMRDRASSLYEQSDRVADNYLRKQLQARARALNALSREGVDFAGEQDIVERIKVPTMEDDYDTELVIRDTKTSKKSPNEDAADNSEQLTGYALASYILDGYLPDAVKLDYIVDLKKELKIVTRTSFRTLEDIDTFTNRFVNAIHAIHAGVFIPTRQDDWRCSKRWCGYFEICPYSRKPKSVAVPQQNSLVQIGGTNATV